MNSATSTYVGGSPVWLKFSASGIPPGREALTLRLRYYHEEGQEISRQEIAVDPSPMGNWDGRVKAAIDVAAPQGFYRVLANLSDGTELRGEGSRGPGYLTFAIVNAPAGRTDYGSARSRFGMQGGFSPATAEVLPLLGVRYLLGNYDWARSEPDHQGQFREQWGEPSKQTSDPALRIEPYLAALESANLRWRVYLLQPLTRSSVPKWTRDISTVASICTEFGPLTPEGETGWEKFVAEASSTNARWHQNELVHPYQITWEPSYPWCFKGTTEQLLTFYRIGYQSIHRADNHALVLGPTLFLDVNGPNIEQLTDLWKAGLGQYIDGLSVHPYFKYPPEQNGFIPALRKNLMMANAAAGRKIPFYGTEHGYRSSGIADEVDQARANIRQTLIFLGEGAALDFGFYIADFFDQPLGGYGYYYNLDSEKKWGTDRIAPKPAAPAFAALTYLIDGSQADGQIPVTGRDCLAYSFTRGNQKIIAVWSYGPKPVPASLATSTSEVAIVDWMGNRRVVRTNRGIAEVTAVQNPQYVVYHIAAN